MSGRAAMGRRSLAGLLAVGVLVVALTAVFLALGVWQLERRVWKLDLIRQVDARVEAPAVPAPDPARWPSVTRERDQYRHVVVSGVFDHDRETLVQAVTDYGPGFWVMTPLTTDEGFTVLVNRGFVPSDRRDPSTRVEGQIEDQRTVTGLLRITEPKGGFLRANDPAADAWRSRDVAAIAARRGLTAVAPYFIDADRTANPGGLPIGGLTVIRFANSHLVYALTWFGMALMTLTFGLLFARARLRPARPREDD